MGKGNQNRWRNRTSVLIVVSLVIAFLALLFMNTHTSSVIIPRPVSYEKGKGEFVLTEDMSIYVKGKTAVETEEIYQIAELLRSKLSPSTGFALEIIKSDKVPVGSIYLTTMGGEENQGNEGYRLIATSENVILTAYKAEGLARGIQTLRQLLPAAIEKTTLVADAKWSIEHVTIHDEPEYPYRGLMIDVARHFASVEEIKRQIDFAAYYKINKIHLHLSDDQGWRLEIKKWPDLTTIGGSIEVEGGAGGYYTQEQFKELVEYASQRYIQIIPEIDMPGHTNSALASYGFLSPDGEKKALYSGIKVGFSSLMCRDEKTYEWIEDVIKEVAVISPSKYIHIGGDEPNSTPKEDYDYFIGRVCEIVEKYGKTPIGWNPADTSTEVSSNLVVQNWKDSNRAGQDKELKIIVSIAQKAYLDMKYQEDTPYGLTWAGDISTKNAYEWDPTTYAPEELVLGIEAALWSETIDNKDAMDYMIYPRLLGHAEVGWTPKKDRKWSEYKQRLIMHGERMKNQGIGYYQDASIWEIK